MAREGRRAGVGGRLTIPVARVGLRNAADRHLLGLDWMEGAEGTPLPRQADRVAGFERSGIGAAIAAHGGRRRGVYESLGVSRKTLYEKMLKRGPDRRLIPDAED